MQESNVAEHPRAELTRTDKIVNRHMARLLTDLADAGCTRLYIDAIKSDMRWLRKDLNREKEGPVCRSRPSDPLQHTLHTLPGDLTSL